MKIPLAVLALLLAVPAASQDNKPPKFQAGKKTEGSVPGKPLDLTGLLGGPSPTPGPSGGSSSKTSDPALKSALIAAIKEYYEDGKNRAVAFKTFKEIFPEIPVHGGKPVPINEGHMAFIGDMLVKCVQKDLITIADAQVRGISADWGPLIEKDKDNEDMFKGGDVRVGGLAKTKSAGRNSNSCNEIKAQDLFANSLIHEVGHMFYTGFRYWLRTPAPTAAKVPQKSFKQNRYWRGDPRSFCNGSKENCRTCGFDPDGIADGYTWSLDGSGHAADANEWAAREASFQMCQAGECKAYARVLDPIFY